MSPPVSPPTSAANLRGTAAMCAAMALFTINDVFVKLAATELPTHQILFVRGLMALGLIGALLVVTGDLWRWRLLLNRHALMRTLLEALTAYTFIAALGKMGLADITAILLLSPLMITAFSALFFGEQVRWRRWLAVIVGFVGMLLVLRPGSTAFQPAAILALIATFAVAGRDLVTRRLPGDIPTPLITAAGMLATTILGGALSLALPSAALTTSAMLSLAGAALLVLLGNMAIVIAFRGVDVSVISPYRYTVIVWAVVAGILVFGDWPARLAWAGIALIVCSGLYTLYREAILAKTGR